MKLPQIIMFLSMITLTYFLIYYYFYRRFLHPVGLTGKVGRYSKLALFLAMYSTFIPFFLMRFRSGPVDFASYIAYILFGFIFILFPLSVGRDIVTILLSYIKKYKKLWGAKKGSPGSVENVIFGINKKTETSGNEISRKDFLIKSNYTLLGISAAMGGYGVSEARKPPRVYRTSIPVPGLPDHLADFKIAQISDVHVGLLIDGKYLADIVRRVNELDPDMVAITGDLMDGTVSQLKNDTACLRDLSSTHGSYFVTGNHEYYSGVDEWLKEIERLGIKILMNENDVIRDSSGKKSNDVDAGKNLIIAGVPDHREGKNAGHMYDPVGALKGSKQNDIKILLAHQPVAVDQTFNAGYHLQLSGHTHGGQFFPYNMFVPLIYPYNAGLYNHTGADNTKKENIWVYVNRGTGYWGPPLRIGVPSEITLLTLEKG